MKNAADIVVDSVLGGARSHRTPAFDHVRITRVGTNGSLAGGSVVEGSTMGSTQRVLGSIVSLWRYPVKSMMGEELNAAAIIKSGLLGDRAYALVDSSDGKIASAKNPRKWPQLFDCRAALAD